MRSPSGVHHSGIRGREPGGDERGVELDLLGAGSGHHLDPVRIDEAGRAAHEPHPLTLEQLGGVVAHVTLDALDARRERLHVDLGVGLLEAHPADALGEAHRPAGRDHRLRRDAVPQVGGATDDVALDHRHLGAEAGGVGGGGVPGGPAADDDEACGHGARLRPSAVTVPLIVPLVVPLVARVPVMADLGMIVSWA
jgi:hypothetical protein